MATLKKWMFVSCLLSSLGAYRSLNPTLCVAKSWNLIAAVSIFIALLIMIVVLRFLGGLFLTSTVTAAAQNLFEDSFLPSPDSESPINYDLLDDWEATDFPSIDGLDSFPQVDASCLTGDDQPTRMKARDGEFCPAGNDPLPSFPFAFQGESPEEPPPLWDIFFGSGLDNGLQHTPEQRTVKPFPAPQLPSDPTCLPEYPIRLCCQKTDGMFRTSTDGTSFVNLSGCDSGLFSLFCVLLLCYQSINPSV